MYPTCRSAILWLLLFVAAPGVRAQTNIGSIAAPDPNAVLELTATQKGLLMPRVQLVSVNSPAPLSAFVAGMQLYNTATANDVLPGIYYSDGSKWIRIMAVQPGWALGGNAGTSPSADYLGTADSVDFSIRTNALERVRITNTGNVGLGVANPQAKLEVNGKVIINSLPTGSLTDSLVTVNPATGMLQSISVARIGGISRSVYVATAGQQYFTTPYTITDVNKIFIYRNGILINCTVAGANLITAEVPCDGGDDVKIIQQL